MSSNTSFYGPLAGLVACEALREMGRMMCHLAMSIEYLQDREMRSMSRGLGRPLLENKHGGAAGD